VKRSMRSARAFWETTGRPLRTQMGDVSWREGKTASTAAAWEDGFNAEVPATDASAAASGRVDRRFYGGCERALFGVPATHPGAAPGRGRRAGPPSPGTGKHQPQNVISPRPFEAIAARNRRLDGFSLGQPIPDAEPGVPLYSACHGFSRQSKGPSWPGITGPSPLYSGA